MIMSKKRILYVEDDETLAFLTTDNLEQYFDVLHCNNGKEAFRLFCTESFDLCVLDIMLPDMDGFEMATEIRKRNQEIPIIFLSAKTLKEDRIKGLKLGADDYLIKPYSIEELILKIE
jgi:DNA-binding response OmpR family regulator